LKTVSKTIAPSPKKAKTTIAAVPAKLSQRIAQEIISDISRRDWPVGQLLGTESELMAKYKVSRATLAEAVRQVERHGVAVMKRGPRGGLTITAPAATALSHTISTYLELSDVSIDEQFEAWRIIEVHACGVAARHISPEGVAALRDRLARIDEAEDPLEYLRRCLAVRIAIADSTGNPALALFLRVLVRILGWHVRIQTLPVNFGDAQQIRQDLGKIVEAIAVGDCAVAQGVARMDLTTRRAGVQRLIDEGHAIAPTEAAGEQLWDENPAKLAEVTAQRIRDDIARLGWPLGRKLGDETELLQRYGVSRWVLRQAIRTLEVHAIIRSKRGQRGGLIVGKPDPEHTIASAAAYLHHVRFTRSDLVDVWSHLLENVAPMAALSSDRESKEALLAQAAAAPSLKVGEIEEARRDFNRKLTGLSTNRVVALFVAILTRFMADDYIDSLAPSETLSLLRQQFKVAQAVVAGDAGGARRAMADYQEMGRRFYAMPLEA